MGTGIARTGGLARNMRVLVFVSEQQVRRRL